jgi:hypothetical protein
LVLGSKEICTQKQTVGKVDMLKWTRIIGATAIEVAPGFQD